MLFASLQHLNSDPQADHEVGEFIDDGVQIQRRQILRIGAAGLLGSLLLPASVHGAQSRPAAPTTPPTTRTAARSRAVSAPGVVFDAATKPTLDFDQLVTQLRPLVKDVVKENGADEESFLRTVADLMGRLDSIPQATFRPSIEPGWGAELAVWFQPLVIFQINMEPGSRITLHDHRSHNGVLLGVSGESAVSAYDIHNRTDTPSPGERFQIRRNAALKILPGQRSTLSRKRDNIHELVAGPEGCRLLDVFTWFSPDARSFRLELDPKPVDETLGIFEAAYKE